MHNPTDIRIAEQKRIMEEGLEIEVGHIDALPLPLAELTSLSEDSCYVTEVLHGGLTAVVYGLEVEGKKYALKKKRPVAKVANFDGQASFLTEMQRRADFTRLKSDAKTAKSYENFIDTIYASYRNGIILSPWIENGSPIHTFDEETLESIHRNLHALDKVGLMEWDLCPGNLMEVNKQVILFDFGYMWPYNPRHFYNSAGLEAPIFHSAERFETRSLCQHLMKLERDQGIEQALSLFRIEKQIALKYYRKRLDWLVSEHADTRITDWVQSFIDAWYAGLQSNHALNDLYARELFRSMVLDMHDDLMGHSCTQETLRKIDKATEMIRTRYTDLIEWNSLLFDDAGLTQTELIKKYTLHLQHAKQWQL